MGEKSLRKRQFILETARKIFMENGYLKVTMKDIVEACEISRGGLYLYFSSIDEIFMEVLQMEQNEADDVFSKHISENSTPGDILSLFLMEQKKDLLNKKGNLTVAIYEYFFHYGIQIKENSGVENRKIDEATEPHPLRNQFDTAVKILDKLIRNGIESGELYCKDTLGTARNIMFVIEGLKIASVTIGINEDTVNKELLYIMEGLVLEE